MLDFFYLAITVLVTVYLLSMIAFVVGNDELHRGQKRGITLCLILIGIAAVCEWFSDYFNGIIGTNILHYMTRFIEYIIPCIIAVIFASVCGTEILAIKIFFPILIINTILQFINLFTGFIYYIDEYSVYHQGACYWMYVIAFSFSILLMLYALYKVAKISQQKNLVSLIIILFFIIAGIVVQSIYENIKIDWLCIALAAGLMVAYYINLVNSVDSVTYLLNRKCFDAYFKSKKKIEALIFLDINKFKECNDEYGHKFGDMVLHEIAANIKKVYSAYGKCYRIGGDEFAVIMTKKANIEMLNDKLYVIIGMEAEKDARFPGIAIGYTIVKTEEDRNKAFNLADENMYINKENLHINDKL